MFQVLTIVSALAVFLLLSFHRYYAGRAEASANLLLAAMLGGYAAWLRRSAGAVLKKAATGQWWFEQFRRLPVHTSRGVDKWVFILFYASFLYLGASGFFFALFVPRGLYGYPLLLHVTAGGVFSACLTAIVITRGRHYVEVPKPVVLDISLLDPRRLGITATRVRYAAFWVFVIAGLLLTLSAFVPMLSVVRYSGQKLMFGLHRYSALAAVLAAAVFGELELFLKPRER